MAEVAIAAYYDRLSRWNQLARAFRYGGGSEHLTVHRALADPAAGGRTTSTRLHALIVDALPRIAQPRVLDAGCGLGGTMLHLTASVDARCIGLTLSRRQAAIARDAAHRAHMHHAVDARVGSYDEPPDGPFDVVVAIESLAHSRDPRTSLTALRRTLAPGGRFIIVDDMPRAGARGTADLAQFRKGWQCGPLPMASEYKRMLRALGLRVVVDRDLSADCRPRSLAQIKRLEQLNRAVHRTIPIRGLRAVMDTHHGGLALERLHSRGLMQYHMLVAEAPA